MRTEPLEHSANPRPEFDPIGGYLDLGMEEDALALARETLAKNNITSEEFSSAVLALVETRRPARWRKRIERAYRRLTELARQAVRSAMLHLYVRLDDLPEALLYLPRPSDTPDEDLFLAMHVYLEVELWQAAAETAERCREALRHATDEDLRSTLIEALGSYCVWASQWGEAIKVWVEVPVTSPFLHQALCGIVHVHAAQTLRALRFGLAHTMCIRRRGANATADREVDRLERELQRMLRLVQRIIPPHVREQLGLDTGAAQLGGQDDVLERD